MYLLFKKPDHAEGQNRRQNWFGSGFRYRNFRSVPFPQFLQSSEVCHWYKLPLISPFILIGSARFGLSAANYLWIMRHIRTRTHTHTHPQIRENVSNFWLDIRATPAPKKTVTATVKIGFGRSTANSITYPHTFENTCCSAEGSRRVFSEGTIFLDRICALIEKILTE